MPVGPPPIIRACLNAARHAAKVQQKSARAHR
jgi:hypothetical protein